MFDKAMKKSIEPYMDSGEELLNVMIVQGKGMTKALVGGGAIGAAAAGALRDRKAKAEPAATMGRSSCHRRWGSRSRRSACSSSRPAGR